MTRNSSLGWDYQPCLHSADDTTIAISTITGNGVTSTNWGGLSGSEGASYGSGAIWKGSSADAGQNSERGSSGTDDSTGTHSSSVPAIVGSLVGMFLYPLSGLCSLICPVLSHPVPSIC